MRFDFPQSLGAIELSPDAPWFELDLRAPDADPRAIGPADCAPPSGAGDPGDPLVFTARDEAWAGPIEIEIRFDRRGRDVGAELVVRNRSGLQVRDVRFPVVTVPRVQPLDRLLFSTAWGDDIEGPARVIRERNGRELAYRYPSELAMQYLVLYNAGRSTFLSAFSDGDEAFSLSARSLGDHGLSLACVWHAFHDDGEWRSPPCSFARLPGGWRPAADLYRERVGDRYLPAEHPAWMRDGFHGWMQVGMKKAGEPPRFRYRDLPELFRRMRDRTGLDILHVYGWSGDGHDTLYPDYRACPDLGGEDDLRSALAEIRRQGGRAILYTNARLIDPETEFFRNGGGDRAFCVGEDGGPIDEFYNAVSKTRVACPGAAAYRERLISEIERMITRYGAHAVQLDQVSCMPGCFCFDTTHDHARPSTNFAGGYDRLLADLRARHRALDPEFFTWAEGVNERFGRLYDVHQGHGEDFTWQIGRSLPEQFQYTWPEAIVTGICLSRWHLCWTHGQGKPFDFYSPRLDDEAFCALVRDFLAVRRAEPDYFLRGRFRDAEGLRLVANGVRGWRIDRADGVGMLVNLWLPGNEDGGPAAAALDDPRAGAGLRPVYPADLRLARVGDRAAGRIDAAWTGPFATFALEPGPGN